jgi:hypothetical protein
MGRVQHCSSFLVPRPAYWLNYKASGAAVQNHTATSRLLNLICRAKVSFFRRIWGNLKIEIALYSCKLMESFAYWRFALLLR